MCFLYCHAWRKFIPGGKFIYSDAYFSPKVVGGLVTKFYDGNRIKYLRSWLYVIKDGKKNYNERP